MLINKLFAGCAKNAHPLNSYYVLDLKRLVIVMDVFWGSIHEIAYYLEDAGVTYTLSLLIVLLWLFLSIGFLLQLLIKKTKFKCYGWFMWQLYTCISCAVMFKRYFELKNSVFTMFEIWVTVLFAILMQVIGILITRPLKPLKQPFYMALLAFNIFSAVITSGILYQIRIKMILGLDWGYTGCFTDMRNGYVVISIFAICIVLIITFMHQLKGKDQLRLFRK